jgi:hypothetical protein
VQTRSSFQHSDATKASQKIKFCPLFEMFLLRHCKLTIESSQLIGRRFLGGQGPAPGYAMPLSEERRGTLQERIRSNLPIAKDGSIPLMARAWTVRGRVP